MTVDELIVFGKSKINSMHAKMLLADILSVNPLELLTMLDLKVKEEDIKLYKEEIEAIVNNEPLQYVIGNVNFYGLNFIVNKDVLIPRFETEELVDSVISYINSLPSKKIKILDLGCGSGCIGLTLKHHFQEASVTLVDINEKSLEVAKTNAKNLNLEVEFKKSDWFSNVSGKYDIIVSNPPYIAKDEEIEEIVKNNEPHIALYAGEDGLSCYKEIFKNIKNYLTDNYFIAMEIGHLQKEALINIVKENLEDASCYVLKDLQGRDRKLFVKRKID